MLRELNDVELDAVAGGIDLTGVPPSTNVSDQGNNPFNPVSLAINTARRMAEALVQAQEDAQK